MHWWLSFLLSHCIFCAVTAASNYLKAESGSNELSFLDGDVNSPNYPSYNPCYLSKRMEKILYIAPVS